MRRTWAIFLVMLAATGCAASRRGADCSGPVQPINTGAEAATHGPR